MWKSLLALLSIVLASPCLAEAREVGVTVYNSDIAVVKDIRTVRLDRGINEISMDEIAAFIDPTSVRLKIGGKGRIDVFEQNFEYDLVSPDKLLHKYLEEEVRITTEDGTEYEGRLIGYDSLNLVLELPGGGVAMVSRGKVTDVVLPAGGKGLIVKPTLFWKLSATHSTSAQMEAAYITDRIKWHAEYVAVLGEDEKSLGLASWVSIDNRSGATYPDAKLKLIAGDIHRVREKRAPVPMEILDRADMARAPEFEEKAFFEYHMYTLDQPTTVRDKQVKQIQLFPETDVHARKEFNFNYAKGGGVRVVMRFENSEEAGLGKPLPAGKVRVYKQDVDGSLEFIGEDLIDHTPRDEEVKLYIGDAFDIVVNRERTDYARLSDRVIRETFEIEVSNHKDQPVTVTISEPQYGDWDIQRPSHDYEKVRSDLADFELDVPAGGDVVLTYTVRRRF
jgi:hypothetical protein